MNNNEQFMTFKAEPFSLEEESWEEETNRDHRDDIKWVQQMLNSVMGLRLNVDGVLGPQTRSAIRSFQLRHGLAADGVAGPRTKQALIAAQKSSPSNGIPAEISPVSTLASTPSVKSRLKSLTCSAAERGEVEKIVGRAVTEAELRGVIESSAAQAVLWLRTAAVALETKPRTATTNTRFFEAFAREPNFVPPWRPAGSTWKDFGDLIALRLRSVSKIVDGGEIRFFCWGSSHHCPECTGSPQGYFGCSSFKGSYLICLGGGFWRAWRAGDTATLASVLLHEALHIYYGRTVSDNGSSGNANCYERFVLSVNGQLLHPATALSCPINLKSGHEGLAVRELQNRLNRWIVEHSGHGLHLLMIDGKFGSKTEAAVRKFQSAGGLGVDGVVGAKTWALLPSKRLPVLWRGRRCGAMDPKVSCQNIKELKYKLNMWLRTQPGSSLLPFDENFDTKTEAAVKFFQKENGLTPDGKVGKFTWPALPPF